MADAPAKPAPLDDAEMTPHERKEAQRYGHLSLRCSLWDMGLDVAFLFLFAVFVVGPLDRWLRVHVPVLSYDTLRLIVLYLAMTALHVVVSLPLSFYSGYLLEHQFGLSTLSWQRWALRYLKRLGLASALGLVMVVGLFWLIWTLGAWWWLGAGLAAFGVSIVLGQLLPVLILPLFYPVKRLDTPELQQRLAKLAEGTGLSIEGVYRLDLSVETVKANAMLAGLGRTRRVLMGDTLLDRFSPEEIDVIFAHEIGHHVRKHLPLMLIGGLVFSLAGLWLCDQVIRTAVVQPALFRYEELSPAALPWLMLMLTLFGMAAAPLQNLVSRWFERQADRYALERTKRPDAFRSAFRKLAKLNKDDPDPPRTAVILFYSHPPISERIALADRFTR